MDPNNIIIPISGAVIGYVTNRIAIGMLFRPHNEIRLFGIKLPFTPGVLPRNRYRLSKKVAETVSTHLLTKDALKEAVTSPETLAYLNTALDSLFANAENGGEVVENAFTLLFENKKEDILLGAWSYVLDGIAKALPNIGHHVENSAKSNVRIVIEIRKLIDKMLEEHVGALAGLFINREKLADSVMQGILNYINDEVHQKDITSKLDAVVREHLIINRQKTFSFVSGENLDDVKTAIASAIAFALNRGAGYVADAVPIGRIVEEQINSFSLEKGEKILISVINRELTAVTLLGGVLGFILGLLTVALRLYT